MVRITCYDMNDASRGYGVHSLEMLSFCHSYLFVLILYSLCMYLYFCWWARETRNMVVV